MASKESASIICLILLGAIVAQSAAAGFFVDLSGGNRGLETPCRRYNYTSAFVEEEASAYDPAATGMVLVSKNENLGCMEIPKSIEVHRNFTFRVRAFLPKPRQIGFPVPIFYADLWNEKEGSVPLTYHMGPETDGWVEWEAPVPYYLEYPQQFKIYIMSDLFSAEYVAVRWFGVSDEPLPPV